MPHVDPQSWAAPRPAGIRRYVPILTWLPAYDRSSLRFDAIAGATIWGLLVPEMIAYSGLAGLPPQAGLYTLLLTLPVYAIFGTSRHVVVAGTSAAAVLLASTVADFSPKDLADYAAHAAALVLMCGALFLLAGFFRLGFIAQFLSRPVMEGFVFGLAIFVTVKQLPKLFGIEAGSGDSIHQLAHVIADLDQTSGVTFAVSVASLAILFGSEQLFPRLPSGLIVLVLGIAASTALSLSDHSVEVVGHVPKGLPSVGLPHVPQVDLWPLALGAAGMLLVIFSESLGAAENFATKHGYEIDPDQELVALGFSNIGSGLVGGLGSGGSLSQSAVNEGAGARSEISPLVATVLVLITVLLLTPLFKNLPEAVLAALIIHAVSHLFKVAEFKRYHRERPLEFWVGLATLVGVVTIDVLPGLAIGVASMVVLVVYHASRPQVAVLAPVPGVEGAYVDVTRHPGYDQVPGLLVLRLDSPLFYANAAPVTEAIRRLVGSCLPLPKAVILDIATNAELDITSSEKLVELGTTLDSAGIGFALAAVRMPVIENARRSGVLEVIGEEHVFRTIDQAVQALG